MINELMASNATTLADTTGEYEDWVELHNPGTEDIDLAGYFATDDPGDFMKHAFVTDPGVLVIPGGGYLILWASGDTTRGPDHLSFALSASGEMMAIIESNGIDVIDSISFGPIPTDVSYGRLPTSTEEWRFFMDPTPGEANTTLAFLGILDPPDVSHAPGFYSDDVSVSISHSLAGVSLKYTTDGSEPGMSSATYTGPLLFTDASGNDNGISMIPTNAMPSNNPDGWKTPLGLVAKGNVLRVKAYHEDYIPSDWSGSYFVFPDSFERYSYPVVSIMTDASNLFDYFTGIYVHGVHHVSGNHTTGNYAQRGIEWERPAAFEYFSADGELTVSQGAGLRIHGGWSRRYPVKSLRVYARNQYGGSSFNYPFFGEEYDDDFRRIILRNSGNDWRYSMFRDGAAQTLVRHFNMATQQYDPVIVFINGEYWGIHNVRERYDRHYLARVYGANPENLDMLTRNSLVIEGDSLHYEAFLDYLVANNPALPVVYDSIQKVIDIDNYLDYNSAQVYFGNTDWPQNNIGYWRERVPYDPDAPPGRDGRYRWMLYDVDRSLNWTPPTTNMITRITSPTGSNSGGWATLLMRELLKNETFKHDLINRMADHLNTAFLPSRVIDIVTGFKDYVEPELPEHIQRWRMPSSMNYWNGQVNGMINFANNRPANVRNHIRNHWGISSNIDVTLDVSDVEHGYVQINSVHVLESTPGVPVNPYPWTGIYFHSIPIELRAHAYPGYKFSHWEFGSDTLASEVVTLSLIGNQPITAHFILDSNPQFFPEPYIVSGCPFVFSEWSEDEQPGNFPAHMAFVYMDQPDPGLTAEIDSSTYGAYNLISRTRINGLGGDGISLINTGNEEGNPGYPGTRLGGVLLGLNTLYADSATVYFTAGTVVPNTRHYHLRLQYRIGDSGEFQDLLDASGDPIEYVRSDTAGHEQQFGPLLLPDSLMQMHYIQLFWRYYHTGEGSGARDQLRLDDIVVIPWHDSAAVTQPEAYTIDLAADISPNCDINVPNGSVAVFPGGGKEPYTYNWSHNILENNAVATVLPGGEYSITVTDASGCSEIISIQLPEANPMEVTTEATNLACYGDFTGTIEAHIEGGSHPLNILWSNGVQVETETLITLWDFNFTVPSDSPAPDIGDGEAMLVGGTTNPPSGTSGMGSSDTTGSNNLAWQTTTYPAQGLAPKTAGVQFNVSTAGFSDIVFTFDQRLSNTAANSWVLQYSSNVQVATPEWTDAATFSVLPLPEGTGDTWYNERSFDFSAVSALNNNPNAGFRIVSDFDSDAGEYKAARSTSQYAGGTSRFDMVHVSGNPIVTSTSIANLGQGAYQMVITDVLGCLNIHQFELFETDSFGVAAQLTHAECFGGATGIIEIEPTGGTAPYTAHWSHGAEGFIADELSAGTYMVLTEDASGCQRLDTFVILQPDSLLIHPQFTDSISCYGDSNASVSIEVSGGSEPFTYFWSNGNTSSQQSSLNAGAYEVTVTDAASCSATLSFNIEEPVQLTADIQQTAVIQCHGDQTAAISAIAGGGTLPYSYAWSNGETAAGISGLPAGLYQLTVTDANGCSLTESVAIQQPDTFYGGLVVHSEVQCFGGTDGMLEMAAMGGKLPYTYQWSTDDFSEVIVQLAAGSYGVTVTDDMGCIIMDSILLSSPPELALEVVMTSLPNCYGSADGEAEAIVSGGTGSLQVTWSDGHQGSIHQELGEGFYGITVTDDHGCTIEDSLWVQFPDPIFWEVFSIVPASCEHANNGFVGLEIGGGTSPYDIVWGPSAGQQTSFSASDLPAGLHAFVITDQHGCTTEGEIVIGIDSPFADAELTGENTPIEFAYHMYSTTADVQWSYIWQVSGGTVEEGQGTQIILVQWSEAGEGWVQVEITDESGCDTLLVKNVVIDTEVGVNDMNGDEVYLLFPNPAQDILTLRTNAGAGASHFKIYNSLGVVVLKRDVTQEETNFEVGNWSSGMYFYQLTTEEGRQYSGVVFIE